MKRLVLAAVIAGVGSIGSANAQMFCNTDAILAEYERARDNEIPPLDLLQDAEKTALIGRYEKLVDIIDDQIVIESGQATPRLRPDVAVSNLSSGGEDAIDGVLALNANIILAAMPSEKWLDYRNAIAASIPALKGQSQETFGQVQDSINRRAVENMLRSAGCPDDLSEDYGVPPYTP